MRPLPIHTPAALLSLVAEPLAAARPASASGASLLIDCFGFRHSVASSPAVAAFERAVIAVALHRPGAMEALDEALRLDSVFPAAHALAGFARVLLARAELRPAARRSLRAAETTLAETGAGRDERVLVRALAAAVNGRLAAAVQGLEEGLRANPHAFLLAKLAHALRFMLGDAMGMLAVTRQALAASHVSDAGHGFLLGCHAFSLEETGRFAEAEATGRRAVALQPADAWAMHAVSHVHEMQGRTDEGIAWLEARRPVWTACNNFSFHLAWHLALFHLERGDHDRVLDLYDRDVRRVATDDFRDVANAVSLLWRLRQEGVAVGRRWDELAAIARRRTGDMTLGFAALHNLLALIAAGDLQAARSLRAGMAKAASDAADQAAVFDDVAGGVADMLLGRPYRRNEIADLAARLPTLGGSHAQRDVFLRSLARIAWERADSESVGRVLGLRHRLRREDRFAATFGVRAASALAA